MPAFDTPKPITATIDVVVGDVRITASQRDDTVVTIRPSDPAHEADARAADQTRVEYSAGVLLVKSPKQRGLGLFNKPGSVDITIELPLDSQLDGHASVATFRASGRLGGCRLNLSSGNIQLAETGPLELTTDAGAITVDRVTGNAAVATGSGKIRLGSIAGNAVVKNSNGDCWIGEITETLRASTANGDIFIDRAHSDVTAATANGDVRVGEVTQGSASLKSRCGQVEIGIRAGTAARLDVGTSFGRVVNEMSATDSPDPSERTVDVRAHTDYGDIVIRRSSPSDDQERASA